MGAEDAGAGQHLLVDELQQSAVNMKAVDGGACGHGVGKKGGGGDHLKLSSVEPCWAWLTFQAHATSAPRLDSQNKKFDKHKESISFHLTIVHA
jgi:hypothetical protein